MPKLTFDFEKNAITAISGRDRERKVVPNLCQSRGKILLSLGIVNGCKRKVSIDMNCGIAIIDGGRIAEVPRLNIGLSSTPLQDLSVGNTSREIFAVAEALLDHDGQCLPKAP